MIKMMRIKHVLGLILLFMLIPSIQAATLEGSVYNEKLELENDVLLQVNSTPLQKYLAKTGEYAFELPPGKYLLSAQKGNYSAQEEVEIVQETGNYRLDLFLLPTVGELEDENLWKETEENYLEEDFLDIPENRWWAYAVTAVIVGFLLYRFLKLRRKYGPLGKFKRKVKEEQHKTMEQIKEDIAREPGYLDRTLDIIKKNDGRINQRDLRREMLDLSEAKISLILTELEHKGQIEKIKKGRGNVIILKEN